MDITLKDVSIVVLETNSNDEIYITPKSLSNGIWPFDGNALVKIQCAANKSEEWLVNNFGNDIIIVTEFKNVRV